MTQISELLDEMRRMREGLERVERLLARTFEPPRLLPSAPCLLHCREWCEQYWEPLFPAE